MVWRAADRYYKLPEDKFEVKPQVVIYYFLFFTN